MRGLICLLIAAFAFPALASAAVSARYVRVENPTGMYMEWQEVEVYSGGTNIVLHQDQRIKGSHWYDVALQNYSSAMLDGVIDVHKRGTDYANGLGNQIDAWFELDLGTSTPIDQIKLFGGSYPKHQFGDKGNRLITVLDDNRRVLWASKWDYFDSKTPPAIAEGAFSFAPTLTPAIAGGPVGMTVPPTDNCLEWVPLVWLLGTQKQPAPPAAAQRLATFKARNTTGLAAFADHFFDLIEPDVAELAPARALHAQGKDAAALDSWKQYWFAKISHLEEHSQTDGGATKGSYRGIGDDLANNVRLDLTGNSARMVKFTPGQIDWLDIAMGTDNKYVEKFPCGLLEAYRDTGNAKYLASWADIMDDWSMNYFAQADTSPTNVKNIFVFCEVDAWMGLLGKLNRIARSRPEIISLIPAPTLARMQVACLEQYGPAYWRPVHDMLFGHASSAIALWRPSLDTFDEFGPGRRIALEWRQHFERWMTMCTAPDGLMVGNEDEPHMIIPFQLSASIEVLDKNPPAWYTPGVRNRTLAWLDNAHKDIFRHPTPGGYDFRYGCQGLSWDRFIDLVKPYCKKGVDRSEVIYAIPEVRRILAAICAVGKPRPAVSATAPAWENKLVEVRQKMYDGALKVLGTEKPDKPHITSDWMPYGGSYYFRSGWEYNDAFVSMLARTTHGGMMATSCGQFVHYDYFFPLLRGEAEKINGLDRLANTAFPRFWTKHCQVDLHAENTPEPFRWHSSAAFAFGENEFTGRFQNEPDQKGLKQVHEARSILQLRAARLFIITDTTSFLIPAEAQQSHDFAIDFTPALSHLKDGKHPYSRDQLALDAQAKTIKTVNPDGPNDALYQFTSAPMQYRPTWVEPDYNSYSARFSGDYGFAEPVVSTHWSVTGDTALVSLMSSSQAGTTQRIASIEALNLGQHISGFHATLRDGDEVWYQATSTTAEHLTCGSFSAQAKNLLVYRDAHATSFQGIALDCAALTVNGSALALPAVDCEFTVAKGRLTAAEIIYRPIDPVRFSPDCNTFTDSQRVTMTSNTANVEIRYTIDGTQPTTSSLLYTKPLTIIKTTEIAARAYRMLNGTYLDFNDFEINGTKFTEPTYGWFYQKPLQDSVAVADPAALQPGLNTEYLEGTWNVLYADSHWLRPTALSAVPREMDLTPAYDTNYYYGMRYKGYVKIPTDGVYTFNAPTEYTSMSMAASYDYRVYVDGQEWDLTQWFHGRSTWSVALKAGYHAFQLDFANSRIRPWRNAGLWVYGDYPSAWVEHAGPPSPLLISGPGLDHVQIPASWFFRNPADATLSTAIPTAPSSLSVQAASYSQMNLSWQYAGNGHSGFHIERATDGVPFSVLATVGPQVTSYQDRAGLAMATVYHYRIRAFDAKGESPYSSEGRASTGGSSGTGLHGDYYSGLAFTELKKSRVDDTIDFDWTNQAPDPAIGLTNYCVRWTGKVQATATQTYTFYTASDDGVRLWVNGTLLIDKWVMQGGNEWSGTIALTAAAMNDIKLEYFQGAGGALVKLSWSSPSRPKEVIPQTQLYPTPAPAGK